MGGIFSNIFGEDRAQTQTVKTASYTTSRREAPPQAPRPQAYQNGGQNYYRGDSYSYRQPMPPARPTQPQVPSLAKVVIDKSVDWYTNSVACLPAGVSYNKVLMNSDTDTYIFVSTLFKMSAQKHQQVLRIEAIENPYLMGCYLLKKDELMSRRFDVQEMRYFHGTKQCNVHSICENNFDWRLHGDSLGNRFGQGISFSSISNYSSHYCDKADNVVKAMFVARVLESRSVVGNKNMILPPNGFDTAKKENGQVIVKFNDYEFYPEYVIYFTGSPIKKFNKGNARS